MFCKNCGMMIPSDSRFCPRCGTAASAANSGTLRIRMGSQSAQTPNAPREAPEKPAPRAFCPHCGAQNVAGGPFCAACGYPLRAPAAAAPATAEPTQPSARKQSRGLMVGLLVGFSCLALLLCAFLVYKLLNAGDKSDEDPRESAGISKPIPEPEASTTTEEALPDLADGQILSRGDMAATFAYAGQIAEAENLVRSYLYDMDGDNVCELILQTGLGEADAMFWFYSYYDGYLHELGSLSAGHSALHVQDDVLVIHYGQMGYEQITELTLSGERILTNCVLDRQLAEGEDYRAFSQEPYSTEGDDLSVLSYVYVKSEKQIVNVDAVFAIEHTTGCDYFTDGAHGYAQLSDGRVLAVDAETGQAAVVATVDTDAALFTVTKNRLYFQADNYWSDGSMWWGRNVFSYSTRGGDYQLHGEGVEITQQDGYILLTSYRSDVSPKYVSVIDLADNLLVSDVYAWDAAICDGAVYYCGLDYDAFWDSYDTASAYTMSLYRADHTGRTHLADILLDINSWCARIDSEAQTIYVYNADGSREDYYLFTGSIID